MNKDDIKKALESCVTYKNVDCNNCPCCPYDGQILCQDVLCKDALNLIIEQDKENEKLEQLNAIQCDAWQKLSDENERLVTENNSNLRYNSVLRKENKKLKEEIKQAQIDVLKELKTRHDYAIKNMGYPWDISQQIDELIKEVENEQKD